MSQSKIITLSIGIRLTQWKRNNHLLDAHEKFEEYSKDCGWPRRPWLNAGRKKSPFFIKKIRFTPQKYFFFCIYLLVMPKYWVKNYFAHGSFPEVGQKQKTEEKKSEKDRTMIITMAKLCMAHASTHGTRKPPGPKLRIIQKVYFCLMKVSETETFCILDWNQF